MPPYHIPVYSHQGSGSGGSGSKYNTKTPTVKCSLSASPAGSCSPRNTIKANFYSTPTRIKMKIIYSWTYSCFPFLSGFNVFKNFNILGFCIIWLCQSAPASQPADPPTTCSTTCGAAQTIRYFCIRWFYLLAPWFTCKRRLPQLHHVGGSGGGTTSDYGGGAVLLPLLLALLFMVFGLWLGFIFYYNRSIK